jgi:small subunit ribosomal protein S16
MIIKLDRVDYWVSKGAKPTSTMHAMIKRARRAVPAA